MDNYNLAMLFQFFTLLFSIKVITIIIAANKKEAVKRIQTSAIFLLITYIGLQTVHIITAYALVGEESVNHTSLYNLTLITYLFSMAGVYFMIRFIHDLYSIDKRRNIPFLVLVVLFVINFFRDIPVIHDETGVFAVCSHFSYYFFSIMALAYSVYVIIISFKYRKGRSDFTKHISLSIIILFCVNFISDFVDMIRFDGKPFYFNIENLFMAFIVTSIVFCVINSVFYYGYSKLYNKNTECL